MCVAVEGLFLDEPDVAALRAATEQAERDGVAAVFLTDGPLGDAVVLAAGLGAWSEGLLLGVRISLEDQPHRHPALLAREMTAFDDVCGGRAALVFRGPFTEGTTEAIALCRAMWRTGVAVSDGPHYPVAGAINNPRPERPGGPPIAVDLTDGSAAAPALLALCDLVLVPAGAAAPELLPPGTDVCQILIA